MPFVYASQEKSLKGIYSPLPLKWMVGIDSIDGYNSFSRILHTTQHNSSKKFKSIPVLEFSTLFKAHGEFYGKTHTLLHHPKFTCNIYNFCKYWEKTSLLFNNGGVSWSLLPILGSCRAGRQEDTGLQSKSPTSAIKSRTYLLCERIVPSSMEMISMRRKYLCRPRFCHKLRVKEAVSIFNTNLMGISST